MVEYWDFSVTTLGDHAAPDTESFFRGVFF